MKKTQGCMFVVDDNKTLVESLEAVFSFCGFEVIKATDAERALQLSTQIIPDIIIADIRMPKLDGITLLKRIKAAQPQVKLILMTGYYPQYQKEIKEAETARLADRVIQKPFEVGDLERMVYDLLKAPSDEVEFSRNAKGSLLVVDDEVEITDFLKDCFRSHGFSTTVASCAEEALMIYGEFRPDVVITDLRMPGKDGFWLIKEIRARNEVAEIVIMTAQDNEATVNRLKDDFGITEYFSKPFGLRELDQLMERIEEIIQSKRQKNSRK